MTRTQAVRALALVAGAALVAACGTGTSPSGGTAEPTSVPRSSAPSAPETPATGTPPARDHAAVEAVPDLAVLIATIEATLEGTSYEGAALETPEVFIATSQLFCELLDEGVDPDEILGDYLDRLSDGGAGSPSDEEALLAGVLLGASSEVVCPEHRDVAE